MTMPSPFSDDLFSAYLDGELTPEERAAVESQLEADLSRREQLDEWADLSLTLSALPRLAAPTGFHDDVMAVIRQRSSSMPARTQRSSAEAAAPVRRSFSRSQGWSAIAAMCLLLVIGVWGIRPQATTRVLVETGNPPASLHFGTPMVASPVSGGTEVFSLGLPELSQISDELSSPVPLLIITEEQIREHLAQLDRPLFPGNTLTLTRSIGETPIVVELTVVDVLETVGQLQVLLRKQSTPGGNNIVIESEGESLEGRQGSRLVAVYLEMDGPNMAALLNSVRALDAIVYMDEASEEKVALEQQSVASMAGGRGAVAESESLRRAGPAPVRTKSADGVAPQVPVNFNFNTLVVQNEVGGTAPVAPSIPESRAVNDRTPRDASITNNMLVEDRFGSQRHRFVERSENATLSAKASSDAPAEVNDPSSSPAANSLGTANPQAWDQARKLRALLLLKQSDAPRVPKQQ